MNENLNNNEKDVEEVPLDLFNSVSLEENEQIEILDLPTPSIPNNPSEVKKISIPSSAYKNALLKNNNVNDSK